MTAQPGLFRELFIRPLMEQKRRLYAIGLALLSLSVAQGLVMVMIHRFFKALFQDQVRTVVPLAELVPAKLMSYLPGSESYASMTVSNSTLALAVPATIFVAGLIWSLASYVFQLNQLSVSLYVAKNYRQKIFSALVHRPYLDIRKRPVGEWMSIVMNDVMFLQMRLSDIMAGLVRASVLIVAGFAVLAWTHWPTALALAVFAPFIAVAMGRTGKRIARYSEAFQRELGRISGTMLDLRARFEIIRAQGAEDLERERFGRINQHYYRMIRRSIFVRSMFAPALEAVGFVIFAACIYAIGNGLWRDFTPALMMQFLFSLGIMLKPLKDLGEQLTRYHETRGVLKTSLETFSGLIAVDEKALTSAAVNMAATPDFADSGLVIERVAAGFGGEVAFEGDSLHIEAGRAVAIVGPSGAGKSTLLKVLAGLVEPKVWAAKRSWSATTRLVSMVSQEPFLFDDTVLANLTYGFSSGQEPGEAAIWAALASVNVAAEIRSLQEGLETRMRAIGTNVSGGQLQRLVIARALLRQKPVLLLDEATSAIDVRSERDITERLIARCHDTNLALVSVTHRLTWLPLYDEVWFVEGGRRLYRGTHEALLREPRYRDYCNAQGGEENAPVG